MRILSTSFHTTKLSLAILGLLFIASQPSYSSNVFVSGGTDATTAIAAGQRLQAAVNGAQPGDIIQLEAGKLFQGPITLPVINNTSGNYITLRSSAADSLLPGSGVRVNPPNDAANFPKILADGGYPAIQTSGAASYFQLIALEMYPTSASSTVYQVLQLGFGQSPQTSLASVPHHIIVDRCYIHGYTNGNFKQGIQLNSANTTIQHSYISNFHVIGGDSDAITAFNTPGPITILNNYLEAAGVNVLFGGAVPGISGVVASNILIQKNDFFKPLSYRYSGGPNIKNMIEVKNGQDITISANLFQNNWVQGQDLQFGQPLVLTPRTENGQVPWATVQRVNISNNVFLDVGGAINISATDTAQTGPTTNTISLYNNLFQVRADYAYDPNFLHVITFNNVKGLTIDHTTVFGSPYWGFASVPDNQHLTSGFSFTNNIVSGLFSSDCGYRYTAFTCSFSGTYGLTSNLFIGESSSGVATPSGSANYFPAQVSNVGFAGAVDLPTKSGTTTVDYHNYGLATTSSYKSLGTTSTDPGFLPTVFDGARGTSTTTTTIPPVPVTPAVISVDFVGAGTSSMGSAEIAGVVAKSNWNNAVGSYNTSGFPLVNESGVSTGATMTWFADDVYKVSTSGDVAGNYRMMRGYLDNSLARPTTVSISGLPANTNGYDVYVYVDGDSGPTIRTGTYTISGTGITTASTVLIDNYNTNFTGTFTQANNSSGNYVKFTINAQAFTLTATPNTAYFTPLKRAPVNGIQIVPR